MSTTVAITGNTYPVKDALRALGGRWNGDQKAWMVPSEKEAEAKALVAGAPVKKRSGRSGGGVCAECGRGGPLVRDMEDGLLKHWRCCDMPPS